MRIYVLLAIILLASCTTNHQKPTSQLIEEHQKALAGKWDEFSSEKQVKVCGADRTLHEMKFTGDGKYLKWVRDTEIERYDGTPVKDSIYKVEYMTNTHIGLSLENESRLTKSGKKYIWELVVVAYGVYRWRGAEWEVGSFNPVWGRRCF